MFTVQTHIKRLVNSLGNSLVQTAGGIAAPLNVRSSTEDVLQNTERVCFRTSDGCTLCYESSMDETVSVLFSNFTWGHVNKEQRRKQVLVLFFNILYETVLLH